MNRQETNNLLNAIDTRSLVDKVEMNLLEFFSKSGLHPGDTIPKEVELAELLGVSRTVIRESLNRLKTRGIVESKKHKGTIIKSPNLSIILEKSLIPQILDNTTLKEIFELRLVLEIGMADFILQNITEDDIKDLEKIVSSEPNVSGDILFDIGHEVAFHGKLYEITGNETLKNFQNILLPVFNYAYDSGLIKKKIRKKKFVSHRQLVEVLKSGNSDDLRAAMRLHLDNHFERIKE